MTRLARTLTATVVTAAALGLSVGGTVTASVASAGASGALEHAAASQGSLVSSSPRPGVTPARDVALIVLQTMSPAVVRPGTDVTITGTVTAPLTGPLSSPELRVVRGDVTIIKREALDAWASGRTETSGRTVATTAMPTVAAGQTRAFTTTVPWERLRSDEPFAALPVSVEVVQEGASEPTGKTRTFVAWNSRKEYVPLAVATVLPVTLDPDIDLFSRDDVARQAAWQRVIGPGSRVDRILEGTRGRPVNLAVDPSVLGPAATADPGAGGPTPSGSGTSTGTPAPGGSSGTSSGATPPSPVPTTPTSTVAPTGQPTGEVTDDPSSAASVIERLGDEVAAQLRGRSVWSLPYADADLAATVGTDPANSLVRDLVSRAATLTARLDQPARADIMWPVDGLLPAGREQGLKTLLSGTTVKKPAGIVVSAAAVTKATAYTPTARRATASGTRLLAYDTRLSALLPRRADPSPVLSVQRYLAESLVLLGERAGTPRSVLVAAPRGYDPDAAGLATFLTAVSSAPWLDTVDAASLLSDRGNDVAVPQTKPTTPVASAAPRPVLNTRRLSQMADQRDTLLSVSSVLRDGDAFERTYRGVLDELASARWRYRPSSWGNLANSVATDVRSATSAIKVASRATVNLLAETGTLQVTIENGLDYTVQDIRLRLAPNNPRIQVIEQPGPITIGPSSRTNVPVEVAAVAAGRAEIRAFLTTADGTQIGSPATIKVSANPIDGAIYWVGGVLVGLVLLFGVVRAIVKGTSRVDEIADIEAVTAAHEALGDSEDRDRR
ncbi:DUF6049 family protein [Terrabacter sp. MAHUQ-38]|uniref:DUF6049 family protein n=1 Tax=unclassified Terrabacter TaxID=2630222 RepID=UPI00165DFA1E|nr:hypothetical protein [Terrabacter sp. MAHUQ-38]